MPIFPLKFREFATDRYIYSNDAGDFFFSNVQFLKRYAEGCLTEEDASFLSNHSFSFDSIDDLSWISNAYKWSKRQSRPEEISYVVLVPTLRCNLTCDYCQVSRAPEKAYQFDWNDATLAAVIRYLDALPTMDIKIEFQGGEPTLRLDLLETIRQFCRRRFESSQFVVCTNLQHITDKHRSFFNANDTYISTSLDGDSQTHQKNRTHKKRTTDEFFDNLTKCYKEFGSSKISALPTLDVNNLPDIENFIKTYLDYGIASIYLRPINYHGFARRTNDPVGQIDKWNQFYSDFIDYIIERNLNDDTIIEEYYFTHCLKRVLQSNIDNHVDLRNPNLFAKDYVLIDFDGQFYPSDEARMLSRIGMVDLAIGNVFDGLDQEKLRVLNSYAFNNFDPECIHCPYQPYCGTDLIDDISRYGTIDYPKYKTWFCQRHLHVFDKVFEVLQRKDTAAKISLSHWLNVNSWDDLFCLEHK